MLKSPIPLDSTDKLEELHSIAAELTKERGVFTDLGRAV